MAKIPGINETLEPYSGFLSPSKEGLGVAEIGRVIMQGSHKQSVDGPSLSGSINEYTKAKDQLGYIQAKIADDYTKFAADSQLQRVADYTKLMRSSVADFDSAYIKRLDEAEQDVTLRGKPAPVGDNKDPKLSASASPNFLTVEKDLEQLGEQIIENNLLTITDPAVASEYAQNFRNYYKTRQLKSREQVRGLQLQNAKNQVVGFINEMSEQGGYSDEAQEAFQDAQVQTIIDSNLKAGVISNIESVEYWMAYKSATQKNRLRELIKLDPATASDMLENKETEPSIQAYNVGASRERPHDKFVNYLSPKDKAQLKIEADNELEKQIKAKEAAQEAHNKKTEDLIKTVDDLQTKGLQASPELMDALITNTQGTDYQQYSEQLLHQQNLIGMMGQMSEHERKAAINQSKLDGENPELTKWMEGVDTKMSAQENDDLVSYAVHQGFIPAQQAINWESPEAGQQLAYASLTAYNLEARYQKETSGVPKISRQQFISKFNRSSAQDQAMMLSLVSGSLGPRTEIFLKEIGQEDRSLAVIGAMAATGNVEEASRILMGRELLKDKGMAKVLNPVGDKDHPTFQYPAKDMPVFSNPLYQQDFQNLAKDKYALKVSELGKLDGVYDKEIYKQALYDVLGSTPTNYKGTKIAMPRGWTRSQFTNYVAETTDEEIWYFGGMGSAPKMLGYSSPNELLQNAYFKQDGPNRYTVWAGEQQIMAEMHGYTRPFIIDIDASQQYRMSPIKPKVVPKPIEPEPDLEQLLPRE